MFLFLSVLVICATALCIQYKQQQFILKNKPEVPESKVPELTQEQLDELYKKENIPSFDEVVRYINEEFSGVQYGE